MLKPDSARWTKTPEEETLNSAAEAIAARGITVIVVDDKKAALEKIKELVPEGAEIMNGSSTTLIEIGFIDFLNSDKHRWRNLHEGILKESDDEKRNDLRRKSVTAGYFLASVNAIAKTGELVACDASGSRVGAFPFAAKRLILVAGYQKITDSLEDAMRRVREYVYPMEDARARKAYGMPSSLGKWVIIEKDFPGRTTLILVKEKLGF